MRGAAFGKSDWSSTATTWAPAPIANSVSVAVGESDTILDGRFEIVTFPLPAVIVTGNGVAEGPVDAASATDVSVAARTLRSAARAKRRDMAASPSPFREGVEAYGRRQVF